MLNLREYRGKARKLSDHLLWAGLVDPSVVLQKDGSLLATIAYRGPDLESSTREHLIVARNQVNNALRRYGEGYCLHFEARRREAPHYPDSVFPDAATRLIDAERRRAFTSNNVYYQSEYFFTITYLPPEEKVQKVAKFVVENDPSGSQENYGTTLTDFKNTILLIVKLLKQTWPYADLLEDGDLLTYLHSTVSTRYYRVARMDNPFYLDCQLPDQPFTPGLIPKLGDDYLQVISIRTWVGKTIPALLDDLNALALPYRWVTRYLPYSQTEATSVLSKLRRMWFAKRKGIMTILRETMVKEETKLEDSDALQKSQDVDRALVALGQGEITYGLTTLTITVWGRTPDEAARRATAVQEVIDGKNFVSVVEGLNAVEAWLGSLPGHAYADVRRPPISSKNLVDLMPSSAIWAGTATIKHLGNAPPLMYCNTKGSTPFLFSNFVGDVGHAMLLGPTGAGKSVKLALMAAQWRRYPKARIVAFEQGRSLRTLTRAAGGVHYDLGSSAYGSLAFQPFANIHDPNERAWASEWLLNLIASQNIPITPHIKDEVWKALNDMAETFTSDAWTMTLATSLIQHQEVKDALKPFTLDGPHGALLDASGTQIADNSFITFEVEELFERPSAVVPVLSYLFHALEKMFDGNPTLLLLDEAWLYFDNSYFASRLKKWLKTLRKKGVSVIFATQNLEDVLASSIAATLVQSCPVKVFLPNPDALSDEIRPVYEKMGLNKRQIALIGSATKKLEYYCQSSVGNRLYNLALSDTTLAILSPTPDDHAWMDENPDLSGDEFLAALLARRFNDNRAEQLLAA